MSEENIEIVRRVLASQSANVEALKRGEDIMSLPSWELWHPDAILEELEVVPDAGIYRGRAEIARYILNMLEIWDELRWEPREFRELGDEILVRADVVGRSKQGVPATASVVQLWSVSDGKITRVRAFADIGRALEAAGLSE